MTTKVSWPRVFAEGVAIVVSILLAFGIQAWWEERQLRAEEAVLIEGLRGDFVANQEGLASSIQVHQRLAVRLAQLNQMSLAEISAIPSDSAGPYAAAMGFTRTFDEQDATLDAILTSGRLEVISDIQLREHLAHWKRLIADAGEEASDFREAARQVTERTASLGGPWAPDGTEFPLPDFRAVAGDETLRDLLRVKGFYSLLYVLELRSLQEHASEVAAMLDTWEP